MVSAIRSLAGGKRTQHDGHPNRCPCQDLGDLRVLLYFDNVWRRTLSAPIYQVDGRRREHPPITVRVRTPIRVSPTPIRVRFYGVWWLAQFHQYAQFYQLNNARRYQRPQKRELEPRLVAPLTLARCRRGCRLGSSCFGNLVCCSMTNYSTREGQESAVN
jgi:hypothetical protein